MCAEPSWHRRQQRERRQARLIVQVADSYLRSGADPPQRILDRLDWASTRLADHHGSTIPRLVEDAMSNNRCGSGNRWTNRSGAKDVVKNADWKVVERKKRAKWHPDMVTAKAYAVCGRKT